MKPKSGRGCLAWAKDNRRLLAGLVLFGLFWFYMTFAHSYNPLKWHSVIQAKQRWREHGQTYGLTSEKSCCVEKYHKRSIGVAMLCFGAFAKMGLCAAPIESVRTKGLWDGELFILTDIADAFPRVDGEGGGGRREGRTRFHASSAAQYVATDTTELEARSNLPRFRGSHKAAYNATILVFDTPNSEMQRKEFKGHLFDYIRMDNILRIDSDILVGRPVQPFLDRLTEEPCQCFSLMLFTDRGTEGWRQPYHGAVTLMNRIWSAPCIEAWSREMDSGWYVRDQGALVELSASECAIRELPPDGITFPTTELLMKYVDAKREGVPHGMEEPLFTHFTKGRMAAISGKVKSLFAHEYLGLQEKWSGDETK